MRTKITFLAAAALAAGLASSVAQSNVYSVNVVGYVTQVPTNGAGIIAGATVGYTMMANQMDLDGTGTNNTLSTVFPTNLPANTAVNAWNGSGFVQSKWLPSGKWSSTVNTFVNASLQPGHGFFLAVPTTATSPTITTVGNVLIGTNVFPFVHGLQIVSAAVPATGGITSVFGYPPTKGDVIQIWNAASQSFTQKKYLTSWVGGEPSLAVGQAVFLNATNAGTWTQVFTLQ
jgi:hypothetical protein